MASFRTYAQHYLQKRRCSMWCKILNWNSPKTTTTSFHSKNTKEIILAILLQSRQITARNIFFATLQLHRFEDHSNRSFYASLRLLDVVLGIANPRAQKRILDEHHEDRHQFQSICGVLDGHEPKCMHLAGK